MRYNKMLLTRLKYRIKLIIYTFLLHVRLGNILLKNRYGERILLFHGVDISGNTKYNSRFVSKTYFEALIKYISTHYNVISLNDFYKKKFKKNTINLAITFDDGYLNNYKYAVPILEKYNIPASFYITTIHEKAPYLWADFLDLVSFYTKKEEIIFEGNLYRRNGKKEFVCNGISLKNVAKKLPYEKLKLIYVIFEDDWKKLSPAKVEDYWKLMNAKHIKKIAENHLFTIGAHGDTHASLIHLTLEDAKKEILKSKQQLEAICGQSITEFAFPFGFYNQKLVNYCLEIGFKKILLVDYNTKDNINMENCKNRFVINPYVSLNLQIIYLLKGRYV